MPYYAQHIAQVIDQLASSEKGLGAAEASRRLRRDGPNRLSVAPPTPLVIIFLRQFKDFIIYILLFAIVFSLLIGEYVDSLIILAILLLNGIIGFLQEVSASRSLAALQKLTRIKAKVWRDGVQLTVVADELVVGDLIS